MKKLLTLLTLAALLLVGCEAPADNTTDETTEATTTVATPPRVTAVAIPLE